jgi:hypothetical protein
MARGGKRAGAGRKKTDEPTIVMRVPMSKRDLIRQWLSDGSVSIDKDKIKEKRSSINEALKILEKALSLKANAGGKIKAEIRTAMVILQD